ncbi:MAG: CorA family divalent cation transporter, partial [Verrucomicrobiota bacterium]
KSSPGPLRRAPQRAQIPEAWTVPPVFRERLSQHFGHQRAMLADGHLLLVLHEVPLPGQVDRAGRLFWRDALGRWECTGAGEGLPALERLLETYSEELDRLLRVVERAQLGQDYYRALKAILPVERAASNLHAALVDAREGLREAKNAREVIHLRDRSGENARQAQLMIEDARATLDYLVASQSMEQSELNRKLNVTTRRLNLLIAVFFPLTAVSTVFGMNLVHGLEGAPVAAFWMTVLASVGLGVILASLLNR